MHTFELKCDDCGTVMGTVENPRPIPPDGHICIDCYHKRERDLADAVAFAKEAEERRRADDARAAMDTLARENGFDSMADVFALVAKSQKKGSPR